MFPAMILSPSRPPPSLLLWLRAELFLVINKTLPATSPPLLTKERIRHFEADYKYFWLELVIVIISRQDTF